MKHALFSARMIAFLLAASCLFTLCACGQGGAALPAGTPPTGVSDENTPPAPDDTTPESAASASSAALYAMQAVLLGDDDFYETGIRKALHIDRLDQAVGTGSGVGVKAAKFALIDLDNDGIREVILWLSVNGSDNYGSEILRYQNGTVYGYMMWYRGFNALKADGTFFFSSSAMNSGIGALTFGDDACSTFPVAYREAQEDANGNTTVSYLVGDENATQEEFDAIYDMQGEKPDAVWHDFTPKNIEAQINRAIDEDPTQYYGEWWVRAVLAYGPTGTWSADEAERRVGVIFNLSADAAEILTDTPAGGVAVVQNPTYTQTTYSDSEFLADFKISPDTLGIGGGTVRQIEAAGADGTLGVFFVKNTDILILAAGGTYFELVRKNALSGNWGCFRPKEQAE